MGKERVLKVTMATEDALRMLGDGKFVLAEIGDGLPGVPVNTLVKKVLGPVAHPDIVLTGRHGASKHRLELADVEIEAVFFEEEVCRLVFMRRSSRVLVPYATFTVPIVDARRKADEKVRPERKRFIDDLRRSLARALNGGVSDVRVNEGGTALEIVLKDGRLLVISLAKSSGRLLRIKLAGDLALIGATA